MNEMHVTDTKKHIIVGISGGVDSSVAAYLLKQAGHQVEGIFMKNWEDDDTDDYCAAEEDLADAKAVCKTLDIPLNMVNFANEYWDRVFSHFLDEYRAGRTPNPDILCNKEIKFNAFLDYAKKAGADLIATGHYVQSRKSNTSTLLCKGKDPQKDQSYFLYALDETQIASACFPVGALEKTEVRKIAKDLSLTTHDKKDSTGICFIGERKFKDFLNEYLPAQPGEIKTLEGEVIGQHDGLMFHTIGQRQGLQIGGLKNRPELPWYVAHKDINSNTLIVVQGKDHPALFANKLIVNKPHWINAEPTFPLRATAKNRYRQADQSCVIEKSDSDTDSICVTFDQPQRAITLGQSAVFYQDDICLGGGIITSVPD